MSIAISEEHRALAQTVAGLLTKHQSRAAARSLLEGGTEQLPAFWAELGGLGLKLPEDAYVFSNDPMGASPWNPDWATHKASDPPGAAVSRSMSTSCGNALLAS